MATRAQGEMADVNKDGSLPSPSVLWNPDEKRKEKY